MDGRFCLILVLTVVRGAYAALVLVLGAVDVELFKNVAPQMSPIQPNWTAVDRTELACFAPEWTPLARWPSDCFNIPTGSSTAFAQSPILQILPYAAFEDRAPGAVSPVEVD
jgi:hypothetical protein